MPVRLLHLSDVHVGAHDDGRVGAEAALRALLEREPPDLVVASGDLTHRNRREQHARAAALLRSLGPPVLAVPGNHDIPALPPARLLRPFAAFTAVWGETEPVHRSERLLVCGLDSVRPWLYQEGALSAAQLERAAGALAGAPAGALRVVVLHHHLVAAPWRTAKRPVLRRGRALAALVDAGAELVLSGHVHQSTAVERREFELAAAGATGAVVLTAPGFGRPRPRRRGEAGGLHLVDADEEWIRVRTCAWAESGLVEVADRRFPRGAQGLRR